MRHLATVLALTLSTPVRAAGPAWPDLSRPPPLVSGDGSRDAALVIAIQDYFVAQDIPGAVDNARAWTAWLRESRGVPTVKTLVDAQATREEILLAARGVAERVQPGGRLWVVYIGHGAPSQRGDDGLLVGVDAQQTATSIEARSVRRLELLDTLHQGSQAETVVILDACFSGRTSSGDLVPGLAPLEPVSERVGDGRATILTAGASDEYAGPLSDGRRPAFSYPVLGALRGWGDLDGSGTVSAREAVQYAGDALFQTVAGRIQTPQAEGPDLSLGRSAERGPDLANLAPMSSGPTTGSGSLEVVSTGGGLSASDIDALIAARQAREAAEAREAQILARLRGAREAGLAEAVAARQEEARALWDRMQVLLDGGGPEARQAVQAFVDGFSLVEVAVEDLEGRHVQAVAIAEVDLARAWLEAERTVQATPASATPAALAAPEIVPGERITSALGLAFVALPEGTFTMGCTAAQACDCTGDESPPHVVRITRPFLRSETEICRRT